MGVYFVVKYKNLVKFSYLSKFQVNIKPVLGKSFKIPGLMVQNFLPTHTLLNQILTSLPNKRSVNLYLFNRYLLKVFSLFYS